MHNPISISDTELSDLFERAKARAVERFAGDIHERISPKLREMASTPDPSREARIACVEQAAEELMLAALRSSFLLRGFEAHLGARDTDNERLDAECKKLFEEARERILYASDRFKNEGHRN